MGMPDDSMKSYATADKGITSLEEETEAMDIDEQIFLGTGVSHRADHIGDEKGTETI